MGITAFDLLKKHTGYFPEITSLYDYQERVLEILLSRKNTLAIIPTGGGKSLLYQLMSLECTGLTIVISPLVALMNEQVSDLNKRGIKAIALNSQYSLDDQRSILRNLASSGVKLLYVAPERLQNPFFKAALIASKITISMIAVDEAHCISQWGSGFRPDYNQIPKFISFLQANDYNPQVLCLTATLAINARKDIANSFKIEGANVYVTEKMLRSNLNLMFKKVDVEADKIDILVEHLEAKKPQKTLAYLYSQMLTKNYSNDEKLKTLSTGYYNAGIDHENRDNIYLDFLNDKIEILFATTAFGMGINIPDIDSVVHLHIPNSIEEYYQHVGRGWRRTNPTKICNCLAIWSDKNFKERQRHILSQKYTLEKIQDAYKTLLGDAEIEVVGQIVNKNKDTLLNSNDYNLQLLKHKLESHGVIKTIGELNGSPLTIIMKEPTPLWAEIQNIADEGMDSFGYVCEELGISLQEVIEHLYEQDLINNIKKLPAMQKDIFFEVLYLNLPEQIAHDISEEINLGIDYSIIQLEALKELFEGHNVNEILEKNLR